MTETSQVINLQLSNKMRGFGSLIIGFEYENSERKKLPGTILDMYRAYKFFKNVTKVDSVNIVTDIDKDPNMNLLMAPIMEGGIIDDKIVYFITEMKKFHMHSSVRDSKELTDQIIEFLKLNPVKFLTVLHWTCFEQQYYFTIRCILEC